MQEHAETQLPLPRLNRYRLAAPCGDDFRFVIEYAGNDQQPELWKEIFADAGVGGSTNLLTPEQMTSLAEATSQRSGALGVAGEGLKVRVAAYLGLGELDDDVHRTTDPARKVFEELIRTRVPDAQATEAINHLGMTRPEVRVRLDETAEKAARQLQSDYAITSVFVGGAQYFAGSHGLPDNFVSIGGVPAEWAFCATTIRRQCAYAVGNASDDGIQRENPVVKYFGIRAYAGVPLVTSDDIAVGALCVMNLEAKEYGDEAIKTLESFASSLMTDLQNKAR